MSDKDFYKIANCKIFAGCNEELLKRVLESENCKTVSHSPGEIICEPYTVMRSVGVVLSGSALVLSADSERNVLLRRFVPSDIFGVSGVFSKDSKFVSRIVAKNACAVEFISAEGLAFLLENDKTVLYNYIDFLSDRIRFLNRKIKFFTSGSAERRLALYLDSFGEETVTLTESMSAVAEMLDIGRASLYRAFDKLTEDGFIIRNKDSVTIVDRQNMINYYNEK